MTIENYHSNTSTGIQDQVIGHISWTLNVPASQIYPYTHFRDDLQMDALDILLLIAELENRLNLYLTPEEVEIIETVQDASHLFAKHVA